MVERAVREQTRVRAKGRCEYCRVSDAWFDEPFWIDCVRAEQHGGRSSLENLAYYCMHCNRYKGPNLAGHDLT